MFPIEVLKQIIVEVYERYKIVFKDIYSMECFGQAEDDDSEEELIIENGIMAYILMAQLLENS